jgi:predicted MFS family arabinose efflux permease
VALALLPLSAMLGSMCNVAVASLLATESPAQPGTTMALNASLLNFGAALGAAAGGVLLAFGGFGAMAVGFPLFAVAGAVLALWPRRLATIEVAGPEADRIT